MAAIRTLKDSGSSYLITSDVDCASYSVMTKDCVIGGMGNEFELTYISSSLNVTFEKGSQCIIGGCALWLQDSVDITLPASSTIYLCARVNATKPNGQTGSIECLTESEIQSGNVNSGGIRDLLLYKIETSASGITSVGDRRYIPDINKGRTVLEQILKRGYTSLTFNDSAITETATNSFFTSIYGANPTAVTGSSGTLTLTFDAQSADMKVIVLIEEL